jgi:hypothetical protein
MRSASKCGESDRNQSRSTPRRQRDHAVRRPC